MHKLLRFHESHNGGILIEFAFSIPVCIALLFFVNDHYRFYELKNKLKSSAFLVASMVQNIKNTNSDKQLTLKDLGYIAYSSGLNFFHTKSMFSPWPLGISYRVYFNYVKRLSSNNYQLQIIRAHTWDSIIDSPNKMPSVAVSLRTQTQAQVEVHAPDLVCNNDGEEKLIIQCMYQKRNYSNKKLGFLIMTPKDFDVHTVGDFYRANNCISVSRLIITPKPGLFPAKETE